MCLTILQISDPHPPKLLQQFTSMQNKVGSVVYTDVHYLEQSIHALNYNNSLAGKTFSEAFSLLQ